MVTMDQICISLKSAKSIYEFVKDHNDFMGAFHAQIIPVEEMPEFIRERFPSDICFCLKEKNAKEGCGVCLLFHSTYMANTLKRVNKGKEKVKLIHVDSFEEVLGIKFCSDVKSEYIQFLYEHALNISNILSIDPPAIMIVRQDELPRGLSGARIKSQMSQTGVIGDKIELVNMDIASMLRSLAHELRHCWQERYQENLLLDYKSVYNTMSDDYTIQPAEIDAEAFSDFYFESNYGRLNYSLTSMNSAQKRHLELLNERKKEISAEYEGKVTIKLQSNDHNESSEEYNEDTSIKSQENVDKSTPENHETKDPIEHQNTRYKKIQRLKSQGYSLGQIARKLGITYQAVSKEWQ